MIVTKYTSAHDFWNELQTVPNVTRNSILKDAAEAITEVGLILEFGVASGYTINILAENLPNSKIYGFDSFKGIPEDWNGMGAGCFAVEDLPGVKSNVELKVGLFEDTLPKFVKENKDTVALLHIDSDLYSSAKTIFKYLRDKIVPGTVIIFDELAGYSTWQDHEFKALIEFLQETNFTFHVLGADHLRFEQVYGIIM